MTILFHAQLYRCCTEIFPIISRVCALQSHHCAKTRRANSYRQRRFGLGYPPPRSLSGSDASLQCSREFTRRRAAIPFFVIRLGGADAWTFAGVREQLDGDLHIAVRFTFEFDTLDAGSLHSLGAADRIQNQLNTRRNAKLVENMEQVVFDCVLA